MMDPTSPGTRPSGRRLASFRPGAHTTLGVVGLLCVLATSVVGPGPDSVVGTHVPGVGGLWFVALLGLVDGDDVERLIEKIRRVEAGDSSVDFSTDREGDVGRLYEAVGDLTDTLTARDRGQSERERRRQFSRTSEQLGAIIEASPAAIICIDLDETVTLWNSAAEGIFGWSADEVYGDPLPIVPDGKVREYEAIRKSLRDGEMVGPIETKRQTRDGRTIEVSISAAPVYEDGGVSGTVGVIEDITERKARERQLRRSQRQFRAVFDDPDMLVALLDPDGTLRRVNETAFEYVDVGPEAVVGQPFPRTPWWADTPTGDVEGWVERAAGGEYVPFEASLTDESGDYHWVNGTFRPVTDETGDVISIVVSARDVTERKEREQALERYRDYTDELLDAVDDIFYVLDEDGRLQRWNESLTEVTGYSDEELAGMDALSFFEGEETDLIADAISEVFETGEGRVEAEYLTSRGERLPYEFVAVALEDLDGKPILVGIGRDISERREKERRLSRLIGNIPGMVFRAGNHPDWPCEFVSDGVRDISGYGPDSFESGDVTWGADVMVDREAVWDQVQAALDERESFDVAYSIDTADGERRWVKKHGRGVYGEDGSVQAVEGVVVDITERVEYEQELERTRGLLEQSQRLARVGAWEIQVREGRAVGVTLTDEVYHTYDLPPDADLDIEAALEYYHPEDSERLRDAVERAIRDGERYEIEARLQTDAGDERWIRTIGDPVFEDGKVVAVRGSIQDISQRKRREAELERTTELLEQAQEIAEVGGWELDLETDEFTATDEFRRLHGLEPEGPVEFDDVLSFYHPDDVDYVRETFERAIEAREGYDMEVRLRTAEGCTRWLRALGEPVVEDGEVVALRGSVQDITAAKDRERALESLHQTAEGLLQTGSEGAVADLVVETAADVLDVAGVCLFLLDTDANQLVPRACTDGFAETAGEVRSIRVGDEDDPIWNCFATGSRRVLDEGEANAGLFADGVGGALVVPIGDHGVMAVTAGQPGIGPRTRRLVETLVATTEAALDRLESEATVRERDEAMATQNRRLRRQIQLTDVIRRVDQSLIGTDSREAVETAVVEELADAGDIAFAWTGRADASGEHLVPRAWAGSGESYLDAVPLRLDGGDAEPGVQTARTGGATVVSNVVADMQGDGWRKPALDSDFRSVLAVPIALEEYRYGVLVVYADEAGAFGDLEREVFAELGRTIASAINAVQTREALHADSLLELRLSVDAPDTFLAQIARTAGCPVEYVGMASRSAEGTRLFFSAECAVDDALEELVTVSEYRLLSEPEEGRRVYEATVTGDVFPAKLLRHGASPEVIRATPSGLTVVVHVPTGTDVREFVEMLQDSARTVELERRRDVERPTRTRQQVVSDLLAGLTDRQREVLRTAYYAGFFDWPRDTTGEELAEMLGVTQPTVSRHLRLAQRHLLSQVFEEEVVTAPA